MLGSSDRAIRRGCVAVLLLVAVGGPSALLANLVPGGDPGGVSVEETDRLRAIRERLDRRSAQKRHVQRQIAALGQRVEEIQARRDEISRAVEADRAEVARLERELDRLVPRLLINQRGEAERERASAQTLATIATLSRASIAPEMRARLRAISPIMLRRLQSQDAGLELLESRAERLNNRHRRLQEKLPDRVAERLRLEMEREQAARQQAAAARRLDRMAADLERLAREEAALSRRLLRQEQAEAALVTVTAERVGRTPLLSGRHGRSAVEAGLGKPRFDSGLPVAVRPAQAFGTARVAAAPLVPPAGRGIRGPSAESAVWPPPPAKPSAISQRARIAAHSEHVASGSGRSAFTASIERLVRVRRPSRPIIPSPDALLDPVLQAVDQRPVITMPAGPGQEVAAPDAGRVAFGGGFGSYGLLLILEHERDYHTILWGFSKLNVATDEHVEAGDIIGVMDDDGSSELRVEFRRNGRPVGILPWLAASSSKVRG